MEFTHMIKATDGRTYLAVSFGEKDKPDLKGNYYGRQAVQSQSGNYKVAKNFPARIIWPGDIAEIKELTSG